MRSDDLLKISQTSLEEILQQEGGDFLGSPALSKGYLLSRQNSLGSATSAASKAASSGLKRKREASYEQLLDLSNVPVEARGEVMARLLKAAGQPADGARDPDDAGSSGDDDDDDDDYDSGDEMSQDADGNADAMPSSQPSNSQGPSVDSTPAKATLRPSVPNLVTTALPLTSVASPNSPTSASSSLKPYAAEGQLEFLEDSFQIIALMIKGNVARMKDDMKKEGAASRYNSYDAGELKGSKRELAAKLRVQENRVQARLRKTVEAGHPLPRLEVMNQRFRLDPFEKKLILLLIGERF